ncbi:MAG: polyprenyl synthetase family protein [Candidatus Micrarchaeaceae archaeon]
MKTASIEGNPNRGLIRSETDFDGLMLQIENSIYAKIKGTLEGRLNSASQEIKHMAADYTDRKGRYIRPKLMWVVAKMFGAEDKDIIDPAAAIQLSEDFVLQIDDMLDSTEMRRGKPTFHRLYGLENAIITPQFLMGVMWNIMHEYASSHGALGEAVYRKFMEFSDITFEGQAIENMFKPRQTSTYKKSYNPPIFGLDKATYSTYFEIIKKKTAAYTVYGPAQVGATIGHANETQLKLIEQIGSMFGIAFQIKDDIADYKEDIKEGQPTIITIHSYSKANDAEKRFMERLFSKLPEEKAEQEIDAAVQIVDKYGSISYASSIYLDKIKEAMELYSKNSNTLPKNAYTDMLFKLFSEYVG